jgi:XTP/dITP diphosphohydrolase
MSTRRVLIATSNPGKLRDFAGAARVHAVAVEALPDFASLPEVIEDGATFEANARKKAEHYSRYAPGKIVLADDSGLEVDALGGEPGVRSARYAATEEHANSSDEENNALVLQNLEDVDDSRRTGRFVAVLAAARDGRTIATFHGEASGRILRAPRGTQGFGYDPLFFYEPLGKTFAELTPEEKSHVSHRGAAFRKFLDWFDAQAIS